MKSVVGAPVNTSEDRCRSSAICRTAHSLHSGNLNSWNGKCSSSKEKYEYLKQKRSSSTPGNSKYLSSATLEPGDSASAVTTSAVTTSAVTTSASELGDVVTAMQLTAAKPDSYTKSTHLPLVKTVPQKMATLTSDTEPDGSPVLGSRIAKGDLSVTSCAKVALNSGTCVAGHRSSTFASKPASAPRSASTGLGKSPRRSPRCHSSRASAPTPPLVRFESAGEEDDIFVSQLREQVGDVINLLHLDSDISHSGSTQHREDNGVTGSVSSGVEMCEVNQNANAHVNKSKQVPEAGGQNASLSRLQKVRSMLASLNQGEGVASELAERALSPESPLVQWADGSRARPGLLSPLTTRGHQRQTPSTNRKTGRRRSANQTPGKRRPAAAPACPLDSDSAGRSPVVPLARETPQKRRMTSPLVTETPKRSRSGPVQSGEVQNISSVDASSTVPQPAAAIAATRSAQSVTAKPCGEQTTPTGVENLLSPRGRSSIGVRTSWRGARSPAGLQRHQSPSAADSSVAEEEEVACTQPVSGLVLDGVVAYVDVRSGADNRSQPVRAQLRALGASVVDRMTKHVTHVVFKDGSKAAFDRARRDRLLLVSALWVDACRQRLERVDEDLYPPTAAERYDSPLCAARLRKLRSMQPLTFEEELAAAGRRCQRRLRLRERRAPPQPAQVREPTSPQCAPPRRDRVAELLTPRVATTTKEQRGRDGSDVDSDGSEAGQPPLSVRLFNRFMTPTGRLRTRASPEEDASVKLTASASASPDLLANQRRRKPSSSAQESGTSQSAASDHAAAVVEPVQACSGPAGPTHPIHPDK